MATLQQLLGARIRICIEKAGYRTVEAFAFEFGVSKATLSDVINGKKSPTVTTLARWANALEIPIRDFFDDDRLDALVRETPPEYFHNRGKTPRVTGPAKRSGTSRAPSRRPPQKILIASGLAHRRGAAPYFVQAVQ